QCAVADRGVCCDLGSLYPSQCAISGDSQPHCICGRHHGALPVRFHAHEPECGYRASEETLAEDRWCGYWWWSAAGAGGCFEEGRPEGSGGGDEYGNHRTHPYPGRCIVQRVCHSVRDQLCAVPERYGWSGCDW